MAEEVRNPSVQVPQAIVWSIPIGALCGLVFLLPIVFTLPDTTTLLTGEPPSTCLTAVVKGSVTVPGGQPIGVMFELIMGSKGGGFGIVTFRIHFRGYGRLTYDLYIVVHQYVLITTRSVFYSSI